MKKYLLIILGFLGLLSPAIMNAQSFSLVADTVYFTVGNTTAVPSDLITNNTSSPLTLKWTVVETNFPNDWLDSNAFGVCDNNICYQNGNDHSGNTMQLWNYTTGAHDVFTSRPYAPDTPGAFNLSLNFAGATSTGTHWVRIQIEQAGLGTVDTATFIINKAPLAVQNVTDPASEIVLYPNPAHNELNVVYGAASDVKTIAIYNIIGKVMAVYKVGDNSANLNLENMPSGLYFVRLVSSHGDVVVTRKFAKQ